MLILFILVINSYLELLMDSLFYWSVAKCESKISKIKEEISAAAVEDQK